MNERRRAPPHNKCVAALEISRRIQLCALVQPPWMNHISDKNLRFLARRTCDSVPHAYLFLKLQIRIRGLALKLADVLSRTRFASGPHASNFLRGSCDTAFARDLASSIS